MIGQNYFSTFFRRKAKDLEEADSWDYLTINPELTSRFDKALPFGYNVKLRQGQLLVRYTSKLEEIHLLSYKNQQFIADWLGFCPARLVRIDPLLGEFRLKTWATLCHQLSKPIFLWIPHTHELSSKRKPIFRMLKRSLDWICAATLLIVLSPVLLGLALLTRTYSLESIVEKQWCVGQRGRLFQIYQFRTTVLDRETNTVTTTTLGRWMCRYKLDKLPQLFNVLKGEMSLIGQQPWLLSEALKTIPSERE